MVFDDPVVPRDWYASLICKALLQGPSHRADGWSRGRRSVLRLGGTETFEGRSDENLAGKNRKAPHSDGEHAEPTSTAPAARPSRHFRPRGEGADFEAGTGTFERLACFSSHPRRVHTTEGLCR